MEPLARYRKATGNDAMLTVAEASKLGDPYSSPIEIGLDYQSHFAHEDMINEAVVPSPDPPQPWDGHIALGLE